MPPIKTRGVSGEQPLHPGHEVGLRGFDDQIKVIPHETIGMNLPTGFPAGVPQCIEETTAIGVVEENGFAVVTAIHDVINRARVFQPELSSHASV